MHIVLWLKNPNNFFFLECATVLKKIAFLTFLQSKHANHWLVRYYFFLKRPGQGLAGSARIQYFTIQCLVVKFSSKHLPALTRTFLPSDSRCCVSVAGRTQHTPADRGRTAGTLPVGPGRRTRRLGPWHRKRQMVRCSRVWPKLRGHKNCGN